MIEGKNIKDLQAIWEDAERQVRRRSRRFIAIIVVICLAFGLLGFVCGRASASEIPTGYYDFETLLESNGVGGVPNILETVAGYFDDYPFVFCFFDSWDLSNCLIYCLDDEVTYNSGMDTLSGSASGHLLWCNRNGLDLDQSISFSSQWLTNHSYGYFYYSWDLIDTNGGNNVILPANLDISFLLPDNRILNVTKTFKYSNYWLMFEATPVLLEDFVSISFTWYDTLGTFTTVFTRSDFDFLYSVHESNEDWIYQYIDPNLISQYKFTVTSATLTSTGDFGTFTTSCHLVFNETPFPAANGSDDITSYNYYEVFNSIDSMVLGPASFYIGTVSGQNGYYFWSDDHFIEKQPFELNTICIPDFVTSISETRIFQLYESYDLIVTGCNEYIIDSFYGEVGFYAHMYGAPSGAIPLCMEHTVSVLQLLDGWTGNVVHQDTNCGLFLTRNALLKQISYFCGDSSSRLLEFELRLVDENDGVLTTIQQKLVDSYDQNNRFFNEVLPAIQNLSYGINRLDFGILNTMSGQLDSLISVIGNLPATDLSSVESSLVTIVSSLDTLNDSILGLDLTLEDVNIIFPEFNVDVIIENNPTSNIEYFVDFVNDFFVAIPDVDFSPLHTIGTDFSSIFNTLEVDSSYSDFLDSLLDPYSFSDSHLSDYD